MIFHSTQKPRMYDYMMDKNGKVIDKNGEEVNTDWIPPNRIRDRLGLPLPVRRYIPPEQRRNRQPGPARGLFQFLPSTWAEDLRESARKEAMKPKYTDQQLRDALYLATCEREDIEIYGNSGDENLDLDNYFTHSELADLRLILHNLNEDNPTEDDGFEDCTHYQIRKGDTVEWTLVEEGTTRVITGEAQTYSKGTWFNENGRTIAPNNRGGTFRRKPGPIIEPTPAVHKIIVVTDALGLRAGIDEPEIVMWTGEVYENEEREFETSDIYDWHTAKMVIDK